MSVALVILHVLRMRHIVFYGLSGTYNIFRHYLIIGTILEKKLLNKKRVCFFLIFPTTFVSNISHSEME